MSLCDKDDYRKLWTEAEMECRRLRVELRLLQRKNAAATSATDYAGLNAVWASFKAADAREYGVAVHDDFGAP